MLHLVAFVSERTEYTPIHSCPRIKRFTGSELKSIWAHKMGSHTEDPMAIYVPSVHEILLSLEIDLSNPIGRSYLVHELVHAQQITNGAHSAVPCLGWLEGEAYRIQAEYLRREGAAEDAFQFEILGMLQGACANAYHPELILR